MKVQNLEQCNYDRGGTLAPWQFYGPSAPGLGRPFDDAPLLSLYWDVVNAVLYVKTAHTPAAADWKPLVVAGVTTTGDVTINGALTATSITAQ